MKTVKISSSKPLGRSRVPFVWVCLGSIYLKPTRSEVDPSCLTWMFFLSIIEVMNHGPGLAMWFRRKMGTKSTSPTRSGRPEDSQLRVNPFISRNPFNPFLHGSIWDRKLHPLLKAIDQAAESGDFARPAETEQAGWGLGPF